MDRKTAIALLGHFTRMICRDGVESREDWKDWLEDEDDGSFETAFAYAERDGMPELHALVQPSFENGRDLVLWNYTKVAHATLHAVPDGWTPVLRQCRGVVFDRRGNLVALPFPKFFNVGEHPETRLIPNEPFEAAEKHDGDLGIAYRHDGREWVHTRGSFTYVSGRIATRLWREHLRGRRGLRPMLDELTLLFEIIHPETRKFRNYGSRKALVLIGAYDRTSLHDFDHDDLATLGRMLGLPVAERWEGDSLGALIAQSKVRSRPLREGWVVRFRNSGVRMKVKRQDYIGEMVRAKLDRTYLLRRIMDGKAERMLETLDEEIYGKGLAMLEELRKAGDIDEPLRRDYLLSLEGLEPPARYKTAVTAYLKTLAAS